MREPPRLRDGGEDFLAATLLDAARAYRRPPSSRHRIVKVLGLPVAVSIGAPVAAIASSLATKVVVLVSAATVLAGGGVVAYRVHARHEARRASITKPVSVVAAAPVRHTPIAPAPAAPENPAVEAPLEDPPPAVVETPVAIATPPRAFERRVTPRRPAPQAAAAPAAAADPAPPPAIAEAPAAPFVSPPRFAPIARPSAPPTAAPALPPAAAPPRRAPLGRELELLDAAERAERRSDHSTALRTLDEYRRTFPEGALLAEAEVLRISALLGSGNDEAAQAAAQAFFARYAPSPLAARVRSMLSKTSNQMKELP